MTVKELLQRMDGNEITEQMAYDLYVKDEDFKKEYERTKARKASALFWKTGKVSSHILTEQNNQFDKIGKK